MNIEKEVVKTSEGPFVGMTFCVTGTLSAPRKEIQERIVNAGGKIVGSVSAKLSVLVAGEKAGSKLTKATNFGVEIWSEGDLNARISDKPVSEIQGQETVKNDAGQSSLVDFS